MSELLDAARNGDFARAKELLDKALAEGGNPTDLLNGMDRRLRRVSHYAAEYDDAVVFEWLFKNGTDVFSKDDSNKSPIDIAVIVDAKLRRKRRGEGEVIRFLKNVVLNPIQQMFFLECGESTESVTSVSSLESLTDSQLSEKFGDYNNLQALHLFSMYNRIEECKYLRSRGVDMTALDDDGNSALHFVSSPEMAQFLVCECGLEVNAKNRSDGHTPAHAVLGRAVMEDITEMDAAGVISVLIEQGADFSIKSESEDFGVAEMAIEFFGGTGAITEACLKGKGALGGISVTDYLATIEGSDSEDSISVGSHDDKVIREDGEDSSSGDSDEDDEDDDEDSSQDDFFIRPK